MNYEFVSCSLNNPLKFTDPSGYKHTYWDPESGTNKMSGWGNSADGNADFYGSLDQFYGRGQYALDKWGGAEETAFLLLKCGRKPYGLSINENDEIYLSYWTDDKEVIRGDDGYYTEIHLRTFNQELMYSSAGQSMMNNGAGNSSRKSPKMVGGAGALSYNLNSTQKGLTIFGASSHIGLNIGKVAVGEFIESTCHAFFDTKRNPIALREGLRHGNKLFNNLTTGSKVIGRSTSVISGLTSIAEFGFSEKRWGDYGKLSVGIISSVLTYSPEPISTGIGISIGLIDTFGGFNSFYNHLNTIEKTEMKWLNLGIFFSTNQQLLYLK